MDPLRRVISFQFTFAAALLSVFVALQQDSFAAGSALVFLGVLFGAAALNAWDGVTIMAPAKLPKVARPEKHEPTVWDSRATSVRNPKDHLAILGRFEWNGIEVDFQNHK